MFMYKIYYIFSDLSIILLVIYGFSKITCKILGQNDNKNNHFSVKNKHFYNVRGFFLIMPLKQRLKQRSRRFDLIW